MDRKWTVIVYMVADTGDSFYQSAMDNVFQMTNAKFTEESIKVLVHADAPSPWVSKCWDVKTRAATLKQGWDHACFLDFAKKCIVSVPRHNCTNLESRPVTMLPGFP